MRAMRAALAVLLVAGLVVAGPEAPGRLLRVDLARPAGGAAAPAPQLQAWLTPPSYTGLPPVFLHPDAAAVTVPAGSHLTVNLTGGSGEPAMTFASDATPFARWMPTVGRPSATSLRRRAERAASWP